MNGLTGKNQVIIQKGKNFTIDCYFESKFEIYENETKTTVYKNSVNKRFDMKF